MQPTAQQVLDAVSSRNYALAVVLALVAAVTFVRKLAPILHGPTGAFLNSKRGGSLLVLVGGTCGLLVTSLAAGTHLTLSLCFGAVTTAVGASGAWNITRDLLGLSKTVEPKKLADTVKDTPPPPTTPPAEGAK